MHILFECIKAPGVVGHARDTFTESLPKSSDYRHTLRKTGETTDATVSIRPLATMQVPSSIMLSGRHIIVMGDASVGKSTLLNTLIGSSHFAATTIDSSLPGFDTGSRRTYNESPATLIIDNVVYSDTHNWSFTLRDTLSLLRQGGQLTLVVVVELQRGKIPSTDTRMIQRLIGAINDLGLDTHNRISLVVNKCHPITAQSYDTDPVGWSDSILPPALSKKITHAIPLPLVKTDVTAPSTPLLDLRDDLLHFIATAPHIVLPKYNEISQWGGAAFYSSKSEDTHEKSNLTHDQLDPEGDFREHQARSRWGVTRLGARFDRTSAESLSKQSSSVREYCAETSEPEIRAEQFHAHPQRQHLQHFQFRASPPPSHHSSPPPSHDFSPRPPSPKICFSPRPHSLLHASPPAHSPTSVRPYEPDHVRIECVLRIPRMSTRKQAKLPQNYEKKHSIFSLLRKKAANCASCMNAVQSGKGVHTNPENVSPEPHVTPRKEPKAPTASVSLKNPSNSTLHSSFRQTDTGNSESLLREELKLVLEGSKTPTEASVLIDKDSTSASLAEWHAAHQLLMLAMEDGDLNKSPHRNETALFWWTRNLYGVATSFSYQSEFERHHVAACLLEAQSFGVLENAEGVIVGMIVTESVQKQVNKLECCGIETWKNFLSVQAEMESLKTAFEQYRKTQRNSQLLGIALQLIPIVGGSIAGVASAGAEIVSGLSVKDVVDSLLDFAVGSEENGVYESIRQKIFRRAERAVSREVIDALPAETKDGLEKAIEDGGMDVPELQKLLSLRVEAKGPPNADEGEKSKDGEESRTSRVGNRAEVERKPSSFRTIEVRRRMVLVMDSDALSRWWAAFVVMFDDLRGDEYERVRAGIHVFMKEQHLRPIDVVECGDMESVVLSEMMKILSEREDGAMLLGTKIRLKRFMLLIAQA